MENKKAMNLYFRFLCSINDIHYIVFDDKYKIKYGGK